MNAMMAPPHQGGVSLDLVGMHFGCSQRCYSQRIPTVLSDFSNDARPAANPARQFAVILRNGPSVEMQRIVVVWVRAAPVGDQ
jgi:hypothetical protein